jgi:hypothetical protein
LTKTVDKNGNGNRNLYLRVDDAIMKNVNKAVRAWNWTTGYTKADLANTLIVTTVAVQAFIAAAAKDKMYYMLPFWTALCGNSWIKENKEIENLEFNSIKLGLMDLKVETHKTTMKVIGPRYFLLGNTFAIWDRADVDKIAIYGTLAYLLAPSFYVMRADYVPSQKNCVARGLNHIREWWNAPTTSPIPTTVPIRN